MGKSPRDFVARFSRFLKPFSITAQPEDTRKYARESGTPPPPSPRSITWPRQAYEPPSSSPIVQTVAATDPSPPPGQLRSTVVDWWQDRRRRRRQRCSRQLSQGSVDGLLAVLHVVGTVSWLWVHGFLLWLLLTTIFTSAPYIFSPEHTGGPVVTKQGSTPLQGTRLCMCGGLLSVRGRDQSSDHTSTLAYPNKIPRLNLGARVTSLGFSPCIPGCGVAGAVFVLGTFCTGVRTL